MMLGRHLSQSPHSTNVQIDKASKRQYRSKESVESDTINLVIQFAASQLCRFVLIDLAIARNQNLTGGHFLEEAGKNL